jgi:hypothetical protein
MTTFLSGPATTPTTAPADPAAAAVQQPGTPASPVDVMFPLMDDEEWPPYPAEIVEADLLSHDLVEITGVPWFATDISRGDIVNVSQDGIGYVGGAVVSRGGHSTVHVMAGSQEEMAPIAAALQAVGADPHSGFVPPMLTVDVPPQCSLDAVLEVVSAAESATCAYSVANRQHRTPKADREDG